MYAALVDFLSQILFSLESIQEAVFPMMWRAHRNSNGNLYVRYLYWNDDQWCSNDNWLSNDWNASNPAAMLVRFS